MNNRILARRGCFAATGFVLVIAVSGCGGDGGPTDNGATSVAGDYDATFTAVQATDCLGLVTPGSMTTGTLRVTQSGSMVTLHISDLREEFGSNPVGEISSGGAFQFGPGPVVIDPDPTQPGDEFDAEGTFEGTFAGGTMDIGFDFTAFTCHVVGTIVGTRR